MFVKHVIVLTKYPDFSLMIWRSKKNGRSLKIHLYGSDMTSFHQNMLWNCYYIIRRFCTFHLYLPQNVSSCHFVMWLTIMQCLHTIKIWIYINTTYYLRSFFQYRISDKSYSLNFLAHVLGSLSWACT